MDVQLDLPLCMGQPPNPKKFAIPLPFGGALKPLVDMSKGAPSDCELAHSLMLQITPMLAGMECVLRLLKVVMALKELLKSLPDLSKVSDVVTAIDDLAECFLMLTPAGIGKLIAAILRMIIAYLNCFIDAFMSIYTFQVGIDITSAGGNPVLLNSLDCAKKNADNAMQGMMDTMEGVQPLMDILSMLAGIGGLELKLPSLSDIAGEEDPLKAIEQLKTTLEELAQIADSLPV
jgi:hypothetical protein